jgi:hypothetical protein
MQVQTTRKSREDAMAAARSFWKLAVLIGWFHLSIQDPGLQGVLFEPHGVFTPLQLAWAW